MPTKRNKMRQENEKRGKEKKRKVKVKILLSAHARTLQANMLHLDQMAAKCMTCKRLGGKF